MPDPQHFSYFCICGRMMHMETSYKGRLVKCPTCKQPSRLPTKDGADATRIVINEETERLHLSAAKPSDWRELLPIDSNPEHYTLEISEPGTARTLRKKLRLCRFPKGFNRTNSFALVIRTRTDQKIIGSIHARLDASLLTAYVGFMLDKAHWGHGFGTEAVTAALNCLFNTFGVARVSSMCDSQNLACIRVLEKAGFSRDGIHRRFLHHPERGWVDSPYFAILEEEFPKT